jgi:hypothetical protein
MHRHLNVHTDSASGFVGEAFLLMNRLCESAEMNRLSFRVGVRRRVVRQTDRLRTTRIETKIGTKIDNDEDRDNTRAQEKGQATSTQHMDCLACD